MISHVQKGSRVAGSRKQAPASSVATTEAADTNLAVPVPNSIVTRTPSFIEPGQRCALIAEAAYYRAEHRGFEAGHEVEDWLAAECDIDGMLMRGEIPFPDQP